MKDSWSFAEEIHTITIGENNGLVLHNRNDFETALHAHKEATDEMKSDQREAAATFYDEIDE